MRRITIKLPDDKQGSVTGWVNAPKQKSGITFVLGHGAGGGMDAPLMEGIAAGLEARGHTCLRFNFPYREAGKKAPDPAARLEKAFKAVVARARKLPGTDRIIVGGKSMGGRMSTHLAAAGEPVDGILLLGYPLHPPKRQDKARTAHLSSIRVPMLFLQGTRDALCDLKLLKKTLKKVPEARLHVVEGGDHSLDVLKSSGRTRAEVQDELCEIVDGWLGDYPHLLAASRRGAQTLRR